MKQQISKNQLKSMSDHIYFVRDGIARNLLTNHEPFAYNAGVYGWNFDAYSLYGVVVVIGYRNLLGEPLPYAAVKTADSIMHDDRLLYPDKCEQIEKILTDLCESLKREG